MSANGPRRPCSGLWDTPMVYVNGDVTTCCLDQHLLNRLGNLKEKGLKEIWWGETIHQWRMAQIDERFPESGPYCMDCNWQSAGQMPEDQLERYMIETGELAALARRKKQQQQVD